MENTARERQTFLVKQIQPRDQERTRNGHMDEQAVLAHVLQDSKKIMEQKTVLEHDVHQLKQLIVQERDRTKKLELEVLTVSKSREECQRMNMDLHHRLNAQKKIIDDMHQTLIPPSKFEEMRIKLQEEMQRTIQARVQVLVVSDQHKHCGG